MTGKLLSSLLILGLTFLCRQNRLSAQSPSANGRHAKRALRGIGHFPIVPENFHPATRPTTGSHLDAVAMGLAKKRVYQFRSVDFPGANGSNAIDFNDGTAVGWFEYLNTGVTAFYFHGTSYQSLNIPGATRSYIVGINASGHMVGAYTDSADRYHGFTFDGNTVVTVDAPNSTDTELDDINDAGSIVGSYYDLSGAQHGLLDKNGTVTTLDFPGASSSGATGINSSGEIVGYYVDSVGAQHGYLLSNGTYSSIDFPLADNFTDAFGINDVGEIAGGYADANSQFHGFIYSVGTFTQVDVLGAQSTFLHRIKNNGNVVGYIYDDFDEIHGVIGH
jgi:uncharacterized membrane protein